MSYHELNPTEMRVIGCLMEKEVTTPDQYPLSLNALVNACNQKSNREPVMTCSEGDVQEAVDALTARSLVTEISSFNSRVSKYQHRFCNTEFSDLQFSAAQTAILCLLFLRGPQTPGELRSRSGRLHNFANREEVEAALSALQSMTGGPFVQALPREAGKRESRYLACFMDPAEQAQWAAQVTEAASACSSIDSDMEDRMAQLERQVAQLTLRISELEAQRGL